MSKAKKVILIILATIVILLTLFNTVTVLYTTFTLKSFFESDFYSFFPAMRPRDIYVKIGDVGYVSYDACFLDPDKVADGEEIKTYTWSEVMDELLAARAEADSNSDSITTE